MSEQDRVDTPEQDEVEAHKHRHLGDDPESTADSEDFEAHGTSPAGTSPAGTSPAATQDPDSSDSDDFEAHGINPAGPNPAGPNPA
jgi:hypothetical protein